MCYTVNFQTSTIDLKQNTVFSGLSVKGQREKQRDIAHEKKRDTTNTQKERERVNSFFIV